MASGFKLLALKHKGDTITIDEDCVVAVIPLKMNKLSDLPISATGKSRIVATTNGNQPLEGCPDSFRLGINAYHSIDKAQRKQRA